MRFVCVCVCVCACVHARTCVCDYCNRSIACSQCRDSWPIQVRLVEEKAREYTSIEIWCDEEEERGRNCRQVPVSCVCARVKPSSLANLARKIFLWHHAHDVIWGRETRYGNEVER